MTIGALKFIALAIVAVVIGVMSSAFAVGQFGPEYSMPGNAASELMESTTATGITDSETMRALRHIIRR